MWILTHFLVFNFLERQKEREKERKKERKKEVIMISNDF
jgi:hypothetical protein